MAEVVSMSIRGDDGESTWMLIFQGWGKGTLWEDSALGSVAVRDRKKSKSYESTSSYYYPTLLFFSKKRKKNKSSKSDWSVI